MLRTVGCDGAALLARGAYTGARRKALVLSTAAGLGAAKASGAAHNGCSVAVSAAISVDLAHVVGVRRDAAESGAAKGIAEAIHTLLALDGVGTVRVGATLGADTGVAGAVPAHNRQDPRGSGAGDGVLDVAEGGGVAGAVKELANQGGGWVGAARRGAACGVVTHSDAGHGAAGRGVGWARPGTAPGSIGKAKLPAGTGRALAVV